MGITHAQLNPVKMKVGNFTPSGLGEYTVTGVGFTPRFLFLMSLESDSNLYARNNISAGTSVSLENFFTSFIVNTTNSVVHTDVEFPKMPYYGGATTVGGFVQEFEVTSYNPDGFTINVTLHPSDPNARMVGYLAIG